MFPAITNKHIKLVHTNPTFSRADDLGKVETACEDGRTIPRPFHNLSDEARITLAFGMAAPQQKATQSRHYILRHSGWMR